MKQANRGSTAVSTLSPDDGPGRIMGQKIGEAAYKHAKKILGR